VSNQFLLSAAATAPRKILVLSDKITATQFISFGQAFGNPNAANGLEVQFEDTARSKDAMRRVFSEAAPDVLVLSRLTLQRGLYWAELARKAGIPSLYHIDDDLLCVPKSLGPEKYEAYNKPERLQNLRDNIEACDLLYVSTPALQEAMERNGITRPIIAGDVYCSIDPARIGTALPATGPVLGYMGTGGHAADLAQVSPAIARLMQDMPELQFEIFGTIEMPEPLRRFGDRVRHIQPIMSDYNAFLQRLCSLGWWVGIAPLEDNNFNRCKADTKWVEYSMAGLAVIAQDLPVYHRACSDGAGILASGVDSWYDAMSKTLRDRAVRLAMIEKAQQKLRTVYAHACLRRQVNDILDQATQIHASRLTAPVSS